jgi:5-methyltetrahydrofolate--homocysteine methyltransferase
MCFDEQGPGRQLRTPHRHRATQYDLLTQKIGFAPHDIIIDANILTVATGMTEHDRYAIDYIEAVRGSSRTCPVR